MFDIPIPDQSGAAELQVNPYVVRLFLSEFSLRGGDAAALCLALNFSYADLQVPGFRISYLQASHAIRRVLSALQDPNLGLRLGIQRNLVSFGLVGFGAMAAPTLCDAARLAIRFQEEAGSLLMLDVENGDDHAVALAMPRFSDVAIEAALVDGTFAALVSSARQIVGIDFKPRAVELVARQPMDTALYQQIFQCPVRFGCMRNRMLVDNAWMQSKVSSGDSMSMRRIESHLETDSPRKPEANPIEAAIESRLREDIRNPPTLAELAEVFGMSERNLRRRLSEIGRSYGDMLDQARKTRTLELIAHTQRTMREVAEEIGFNDPRSLRRAFKRWTGKTLASAMAGVVASRSKR